MKRALMFLWFFWTVLLVSPNLRAETVPAASCSRSDVMSAIAACNPGDVITLPECDVVWDSYVTIDKSLTINGMGVGKTKITDNSSGEYGLFYINMGSSERAVISGLDILAGPSQSSTRGVIYITGSAQDYWKFRVHSCRFTGMKTLVIHVNDVYGLIDHNEFYDTAFGFHAVFVEGDRNEAFNRPVELGSGFAVYVEDNVFKNVIPKSAWLEQWDGSRVVARYNGTPEDPMKNVWVSSHGYDDVADGYRGPILLEYYGNHADCDGNCYAANKFRGGTGVIFDNSWTETGAGQWSGGTDHGITMVYYGLRDAGDNVCGGGSHSWATRCVDYPCMDQPGFNGKTSNPIYIWNNQTPPDFINVYDGPNDGYNCDTDPKAYNLIGMCDAGVDVEQCFIREGRDYFLSAPSSYMPFTYPHPMQGLPAPAPPKNVYLSTISPSIPTAAGRR